MPKALGQSIGGYEILELLDSSRESVTYKVRNTFLQRLEVLRVLPRSLQDDQELVTRFLREAKVHSRMSHPNIAAFYHAAQVDGQLIMTSELVEGTTLAFRRESGALPRAEALACIKQVLSALEYAHSFGVVHRDVTPANVILRPDGAVKLAGFGLAKTTTDPQLTKPGTVLGSLNYLSPEQVKGLAAIDARTDIYSAGVVLYELLTGQRPFHRKSQFEVMLAHVSDLPAAPSIVNPDVPAELSEIVLTAMAKDPNSRFQSAAEFQQRLDRVSSTSGAAPFVPAVQPAAHSTGSMFQQSLPAWDHLQLVIAGGVTFLVVILTVLAMLQRG